MYVVPIIPDFLYQVDEHSKTTLTKTDDNYPPPTPATHLRLPPGAVSISQVQAQYPGGAPFPLPMDQTLILLDDPRAVKPITKVPKSTIKTESGKVRLFSVWVKTRLTKMIKMAIYMTIAHVIFASYTHGVFSNFARIIDGR